MILFRYIGSTIIKFNLLVLLIVLGMEFFILLIGEFVDIGHGGYGLLEALIYVILSLPANLYSLFPMIALLGSLVGLGSLATHAELIVMRTSGLSVWRIILAVLQAALLLIILITMLGEWVAPLAQHLANQEKISDESHGQALATQEGIWLKEKNIFVNISQVISDSKLEGITEYEFNADQQLTSVFYAKSAEKKKKIWWLNDVNLTELSAKTAKSQVVKLTPWQFELDSRLLGISKDNITEMSLADLYHYIKFRKNNGLASGSFALTFWQRILQPLSSLVMIFLAVPFVFGPLRSVTMGVRIVSGALLGFAFYLLDQFFGPLSLVYQIPPLLGALLPILIFIVLALYLMRRAK